MKHKDVMVTAICDELRFRKSEYHNTTVETIYLGGGTPSVLEPNQIDQIVDAVYAHYTVSGTPEISLEANPDDLDLQTIEALGRSKINRLSIGVQSFNDADLKLMNRAHNSEHAVSCIALSRQLFPNISIDLIYGIPGMDDEGWRKNLQKAIELGVPHIASYALTVEDKTALKSFIEKGVVAQLDDEQAQRQFDILVDTMQLHGFAHYEFSNFGKPGFFSRNNTAYWTGVSYIGIGPSAHSFNGTQRGWNINNNMKYLKSIQAGVLPIELEELSLVDSYNEYIMIGLRTIYGVSIEKVAAVYGTHFKEYMLEQAQEHIENHLLYVDGDTLQVTRKGKFLSDGIASDLFMLNLGG
jgi:oxygen-independent coproporphyrinogen-3 oxidase